jgi:hypothetical protein
LHDSRCALRWVSVGEVDGGGKGIRDIDVR